MATAVSQRLELALTNRRKKTTTKPLYAGPTTTEEKIRHLLRRAGFGDSPKDVAGFRGLTLTAAVDRLVDFEQTPDNLDPAFPALPRPSAFVSMRGMKRTVTGRDYLRYVAAIQAWWVNRMATTNRPLQEKMTLFWHGHFATGLSKVHVPQLMLGQYMTFRNKALGRFDDMVYAMAIDPAMLVWLDGRLNVAKRPNENWGREVMELFTLGVGDYTEDDVHASSRSFTGWRLNRDGKAVFVPRLHDSGQKSLLGHTGNWGARDAVRILCEQPACAAFIAAKLWRFFATDTPNATVIARLAQVYVDSNHSIREMVRTLFNSPEFYSADVYWGHIKSPAEYIAGTMRAFGAQVADGAIAQALTVMGQQLFNPSNVGGWPGGPTWLNASTLLARFQFADHLVRPSLLQASAPIDVLQVLTDSGASTVDELISYVAHRAGTPLTPSTKTALQSYMLGVDLNNPRIVDKTRGLLQLTLVSPEYQLM